MLGNVGFKRMALALVAVVFCVLLFVPSPVAAQTPPPPVEKPATPDGLGDCVEGTKVSVLNDDFNGLPEDQSKRNNNGGFETYIVTNCRAYAIDYEVIDQDGKIVPGTSDTYLIDNYDEVEWVELTTIVYETHPHDVVDPADPTKLLYPAGSAVVDENGNAIIANNQPDPVTAYRFKFEFENKEITLGTETKRPLNNNQEYQLKFDVIPYLGAPSNHVHTWIFDIVAKLSGNWWQKIINVLSPTQWLEKGLLFVFRGYGAMIQGGMCEAMSNVMTTEERLAFTRYDSDGDGKITDADTLVDGAGNPHESNANGNCNEPEKSPEEELADLQTANYKAANERRAIAGLPPLPSPASARDTYLFEVIDGYDPRDRSRTFAERVRFEISHITLAPRLAANSAAAAPLQGIHGGISTFTGLLTGTPPELTYERGIVRIGWSVIFNITLVVVVLVIAWIGFTQILRVFLGGRGLADWRETIPRLILAVLGAMLSYWFCAICIDVADGVSRYIAGAMRITPADITLVMGQALMAALLKNVQTSWLAAVPIVGLGAVAVKVAVVGGLVLLLKIFAISVLLVIAQFVMRIGLLCLLIVTSPLGMLMWALPETAGWGRRWVSLFFTTLFQHGLQLICFATALWFIRLATPIGIVADTGSVSGALEAVLPTKMAYTLILGTILMIVTFKIPSLLGQGGLQESFISTISMAALGARALGFVAGGAGGGTGPLSWLGAGRGPSSGPGLTSAGLQGGDPMKGVASGVFPSAANMGAAGLTGAFRATRTAAAHITGHNSWAPQPSGQQPLDNSGNGSQGSGDGLSGSEQGTASGGLPAPMATQGQVVGTQQTSGMQQGRGTLPDWRNRMANGRQASGVQQQGAQQQGIVPGSRAGSTKASDASSPPNRRVPGSREGSTAYQRETAGMSPERRSIRDVGHVSRHLGASYLPRGRGNGLRAISPNYVQDGPGGVARPTTAGERAVIRDMGVGRFNSVMNPRLRSAGLRSAAAAQSVCGRQSVDPGMDADRQRGSQVMGVQNFNAGQGSIRSVNGMYVRDHGQVRVAKPSERSLIREMGRMRFDRMMGTGQGHTRQSAVQEQSGAGGRSQDVSGGAAQDVTQGRESREGLGGRMRESFRQGYQEHMDKSRVPMIRHANGRVVPETSEGALARRTLGEEEYANSSNREIQYAGSGAWMNVGGSTRALTSDQSYARSVMGDEEFGNAMQNNIRYEGNKDSEGRELVTENGQERLATPAEQRLMRKDELGTNGFNRLMGTQERFMGEGHFVRDERTTRLATEGEAKYFDQVGEARFNDVMGQRFEQEGTAYRVDAVPTRQEVFDQVRTDTPRVAGNARSRGIDMVQRGSEMLDRGRDAMSDAGTRTGLGSAGGGGETPPPYDTEQQRRSEEQRENRERYYGFRTDLGE